MVFVLKINICFSKEMMFIWIFFVESVIVICKWVYVICLYKFRNLVILVEKIMIWFFFVGLLIVVIYNI